MLDDPEAGSRPPNIYVTRLDHHTLSAMVGAGDDGPPGAAMLREELDRALVVDEGELPQAFARLGSTVTFEDVPSGRVRTVQLVLPDAADIDLGRVSVFSPVGAALLGLTRGPTISLAADGGRPQVLRILKLGG